MFRVTPNVFVAQTIRAAQQHGTRLSQWQTQASSGLKLNKPSDDPVGTRAILGVRGALSRMRAELSNITSARQRLSVANTELLDAQQILVRVKEIALEARQAIEPSERQALADELGGLRQRLIAIANARHDGQYLFGGAAGHLPPFEIGPGGSVLYRGADQPGSTDVRAATQVDVLYSGAEVFQLGARQPTQFQGSTGAAPGAGIDSGIGYGELLVLHTATTYAPGSGVTAGSGSVAADTILGPAGAHTLTVVDTSGTGAFGTVSLNGGIPVAFSSSDSNLRIIGPSGEVVYIDTTAITPGFSGTVAITADGALSTDGGATQLAIDFSANQQVVDANGRVTHVDSSNIRATGVEALDYAGTADVFEVLQRLQADLIDHAHAGTGEWHHALSRHMEDVERLQDHLLNIVGVQAVSLENLDSLASRIGELQLEQQKIASDIEAADMAEVVLRLQQEQTMLQFTLAGTARLFAQSLADYL